MAAKRKYKLESLLEVLSSSSSLSTGIIARKLKCHISTALRYLRELKASKQVIAVSYTHLTLPTNREV